MNQAQRKDRGPQKTAVMASMHTTKVSAVRYRESEYAYSFQAWARSVVWLAMVCGLKAKYPWEKSVSFVSVLSNQYSLSTDSLLTFQSSMDEAAKHEPERDRHLARRQIRAPALDV